MPGLFDIFTHKKSSCECSTGPLAPISQEGKTKAQSPGLQYCCRVRLKSEM